MTGVDPTISLFDIANIPAELQKKLKVQKITQLAQLFFADGKLHDALTLAEKSNLSVHDAVGVRQHGRRYMETLFEELIAKRKIEPLQLLWKLHWLLGVIPDGDQRANLVILEASAIEALLENFNAATVEAVDQVLQILLHRQLIISDKIRRADIAQLIELCERFQKRSLLAYQIAKVKPELLILSQTEEPTKQIAQLRKLSSHWKSLHRTIKEKRDEKVARILNTLQAYDSLKVLDISEKHLAERLQETMSPEKLRQSQLTHITTIMNAAIDLYDAYLAAKCAARASQTWFELAQSRPGKGLGDDLLRSLRFARTAVFYYRVLDDTKGAIQQLEHLIHFLGEIPADPVATLQEALIGVLNTFNSTLPLLDRPADHALILKASQRFNTTINRVEKQLPTAEARYNLATLHMKYQQTALEQLNQLGVDQPKIRELTLGLIRALLHLVDTAPAKEKDTFLNQAIQNANSLIARTKPISNINHQELEVISAVAGHITQQPPSVRTDAAKQVIEVSHQLNEELYFQTKNPQLKAQLALQLLLSMISPDSAGGVQTRFSTKELDKLEEYASTALIAHVKDKTPNRVLKAGSVLVWVILQRIQLTKSSEEVRKLKGDARDFIEKTYSFMPSPDKLMSEDYPFAFLLLHCVNELVRDERPTDESEWETLLTQSEQFAQNLAKVAASQGDGSHQILALSVAGIATAQLATLTSSSSQRSRLLKRATTQIRKALQAAVVEASPADIEAALLQYDKLTQNQLTTTPIISAQVSIFEEWDQAYSEAIQALEQEANKELLNKIEAHRILNVKIPLTFSLLQQEKMSIESVRRQLTDLLHEVSRIGSTEQVTLAKQLEKRWAFQLDEDSLLASGFRLEDAETSFTLADEHFRISLQVEPSLTIHGQHLKKIRSFPFLRSASQSNSLTWYDETPVICSLYSNERLYTWLTIQDPSTQQVTIGYWIIATEDLTATIRLEILAVEALSQDTAGVTVKLAGAQISLPKQPVVAERREERGILVYELNLTAGYPEALPLQISIS